MEALTRLVSDSLARHGLDCPVDPRRLQWSRWFRCDSPHSLLVVPSKPGIFALAEEIIAFTTSTERGPGTDGDSSAERSPSPERAASTEGRESSSAGTALAVLPTRGEPAAVSAAENRSIANRISASAEEPLGGAALQRCNSEPASRAALAAEVISKRMLAVLQFAEDDNMAYVLDRMFTYINPMRSRLHSGNCFVRFVVVEDQQQRHSICAALNQWMRNSSEKASGLPAEFLSSLELPNVVEKPRGGRTLPSTGSEPVLSLSKGQALSANPEASTPREQPGSRGAATNLTRALSVAAPPHPDSGAGRNLHCPQPLPSGF
jgi:hypothetical protein